MANGTDTKSETVRELIDRVGVKAAAQMLPELSADDMRLVDEALAENGGSYAKAHGVRDPELAAEIDALFAGGAR